MVDHVRRGAGVHAAAASATSARGSSAILSRLTATDTSEASQSAPLRMELTQVPIQSRRSTCCCAGHLLIRSYLCQVVALRSTDRTEQRPIVVGTHLTAGRRAFGHCSRATSQAISDLFSFLSFRLIPRAFAWSLFYPAFVKLPASKV
jgi:hypothetical protein